MYRQTTAYTGVFRAIQTSSYTLPYCSAPIRNTSGQLSGTIRALTIGLSIPHSTTASTGDSASAGTLPGMTHGGAAGMTRGTTHGADPGIRIGMIHGTAIPPTGDTVTGATPGMTVTIRTGTVRDVLHIRWQANDRTMAAE